MIEMGLLESELALSFISPQADKQGDYTQIRSRWTVYRGPTMLRERYDGRGELCLVRVCA